MSRRKFTISRSFIARVVAIGILVAMGTFAVIQSRSSKPKDEVAKNEANSAETDGASTDPTDKDTVETSVGTNSASVPPARPSASLSGSSAARPAIDPSAPRANVSGIPASNPGGLPASIARESNDTPSTGAATATRPSSSGFGGASTPAPSLSGAPGGNGASPGASSAAGPASGSGGGFNPSSSTGLGAGSAAPPAAPSASLGGGGFRAAAASGARAPALLNQSNVPPASTSTPALPTAATSNSGTTSSLPPSAPPAVSGGALAPSALPSSAPPASIGSVGTNGAGEAGRVAAGGLSAALGSVAAQPSASSGSGASGLGSAPPSSNPTNPTSGLPSLPSSTANPGGSASLPSSIASSTNRGALPPTESGLNALLPSSNPATGNPAIPAFRQGAQTPTSTDEVADNEPEIRIPADEEPVSAQELASNSASATGLDANNSTASPSSLSPATSTFVRPNSTANPTAGSNQPLGGMPSSGVSNGQASGSSSLPPSAPSGFAQNSPSSLPSTSPGSSTSLPSSAAPTPSTALPNGLSPSGVGSGGFAQPSGSSLGDSGLAASGSYLPSESESGDATLGGEALEASSPIAIPADARSMSSPGVSNPVSRTPSLAPSGLPSTSQGSGAMGAASGGFRDPTYPSSSTTARALPVASSATAATAIPDSTSDRTSDLPGGNELQGEQAPSLVIEKLAPLEAQVGQPAVFELIVKNVGNSTAQEVVVTDRVPAGARLESAEPQAARRGANGLVWSLGSLRPGAEARIRMVLVPERTGEIGSVAQVTFQAQASSRIVVTQPKLSMRLLSAEAVRIGEQVEVQIRIANDGDGDAREVILETDVSDRLSHPAGSEIRYEVGTLAAGEATQVNLTLTATQAGAVRQKLVAYGPATQAVEQTLELQVVSPDIAFDVKGPSLRFLERKAIHRLTIANRGSASAREVELVATLPRGLQFVSADQEGTYDPRTHAVYWSLLELPAGQEGAVRMETIPIETGDYFIDFSIQAEGMQPLVDRQEMSVRQLAELAFEIDDEVDQVEIGSETVYRVRVENQGTKESRQVSLRLLFPPGIEPTDEIRSPLRYQRRGNEILFETLEQLAPNESFEIAVTAIGKQAGDQTVAVETCSEERPDWVRKEESTHVYADR